MDKTWELRPILRIVLCCGRHHKAHQLLFGADYFLVLAAAEAKLFISCIPGVFRNYLSEIFSWPFHTHLYLTLAVVTLQGTSTQQSDIWFRDPSSLEWLILKANPLQSRWIPAMPCCPYGAHIHLKHVCFCLWGWFSSLYLKMWGLCCKPTEQFFCGMNCRLDVSCSEPRHGCAANSWGFLSFVLVVTGWFPPKEILEVKQYISADKQAMSAKEGSGELSYPAIFVP